MHRLGDKTYLQTVENGLNKTEVEAKMQLADLWFIWWVTTHEQRCCDKATGIWEEILPESGELYVHAIYMLAHLTSLDKEAKPEKIREMAMRLMVVRDQIKTDVERVEQFTALAQKLGEQYSGRCNQ